MSGFVLDASVAASWLLPDEFDVLANRLLEGLDGFNAHVPAIWDYEIHNILVINERRGRISRLAADAAIGFFQGLNISRDFATDWRTTTQLSRQFALTVYDAAYLELAQRLDVKLATFDRHLAKAASSMGKLLDA